MATNKSVSNSNEKAECLTLCTNTLNAESEESVQHKIDMCVDKVNNLYKRLVNTLGLKSNELLELPSTSGSSDLGQKLRAFQFQQATREFEEEDFTFDPFELPLGCAPLPL